MKPFIQGIALEVCTTQAYATIGRRGEIKNYVRVYWKITPASFGRVQRAQAAIMKGLFGRSKSR